MKKVLTFFKPFEWILLLLSWTLIISVFFIFKNTDYVQLAGCLIGVFSIMLVSKGTPLGQVTTIIFSVFYGIVSYYVSYYGEMITYLGMTTPIAIFALISWIRNPSKENKNEVKVNHLTLVEYILMLVIALVVTIAFYFILRALNTNNLIVSTISVYTSFIAAYMTLRRSKFYALGYLANDVVLIVLWSMATVSDFKYLSMVITICIFFINDTYGFINWSRLERKQYRHEVSN